MSDATLPASPGRPARRPARSTGRRLFTPPRMRRCRHVLLGSLAVLLFGPPLAFTLGYLLFAVPNPDDAVNNQVAVVSFADGTPLTRLVPAEGNRIKVPIEAVPAHVRDAVLAAEDRSFYSNPGFDLTGILRAAWNQVRGGSGGGSTITQQFVKKALVGDEQTLWRKYKEVVLAVKISQERTKDQILGDYLNTIYFGRGAYGIESASQAYFRTGVGDLTPTQGAMLAGLIQSPSRWDPAVDPGRAVERWTFVLDGMVAQGRLDPVSRRSAQFPATQPRRVVSGGMPADSRGHIVTAVRAELEELGISEQDLAQEGLLIATTIDPRRQREAVDAAHDALDGQPANLRAATVAIDPDTGGVLAYFGGDNGQGLDYARVRRLAGSTFKPFVVLAGLLQDPPVGLGETFDGAEVSGLRNADGADCERCDLKQAMTVSNNVVFNSLARRLGPDSVADAARTAGITAPLDDPNAGIALGNKEVSAFELASAYATIAAGGMWRHPHVLASVVTAQGRVLYEVAADGERRFPERVARNVTEAMLDVAARTGLGLPGGRPVAAKTGTVQSRFDGENNDAWMAGFTPTMSASVWMGTDMNSPIRTATGMPINGASLPGAVWRELMTNAHDDEPVENFVPFRPIGRAPSSRSPGEVTRAAAPTGVGATGGTADGADSTAPAPPRVPADPGAAVRDDPARDTTGDTAGDTAGGTAGTVPDPATTAAPPPGVSPAGPEGTAPGGQPGTADPRPAPGGSGPDTRDPPPPDLAVPAQDAPAAEPVAAPSGPGCPGADPCG